MSLSAADAEADRSLCIFLGAGRVILINVGRRFIINSMEELGFRCWEFEPERFCHWGFAFLDASSRAGLSSHCRGTKIGPALLSTVSFCYEKLDVLHITASLMS